MPPKSRSQARLMRAVASGDAKVPGLSKAEATEYVKGYSTKRLPEQVKAKRKKKK